MKNILTCIILFTALPLLQPGLSLSASFSTSLPGHTNWEPARNLFIITLDGFRWQELFEGADGSLIHNPEFTPDTAMMKMQYWANSKQERRQKLMPFFWSVIAQKGQVYGNRHYGNKVNTKNIYNFSYPGYNEIFAGNTDLLVASNRKIPNSNTNVLEQLNSRQGFSGKVVAFTSWNVFPFILNEDRSGILINSGYENMEPGTASAAHAVINKVQNEAVNHKGGTRYDQLTFLTAKEYLYQHRPRVVFIGFGETDEYAHAGRYDLYLQSANNIDRMLADLWHWVQTTPGYKDNTNLLITTDHGRGSAGSKWTSHMSFIRRSSQTWLALMGPGLEPLGEVKERQQHYQVRIAGLIAELVGEKFEP